MSDDLKALFLKRSDPEAIEFLLRDALLYMEKYEARIAELERALGEAWTPLPDGVCREAIGCYGEELDVNGGCLDIALPYITFDLPDDIRLCRRTSSSPTAGA